MKQDFLFELGCEEIPARLQPGLVTHLREGLEHALTQAKLAYDGLKIYVTPRRLAVMVEQLAEQQPSQIVQRRGPAYQAAYDPQGNPTPAALGFAASCGVAIDALSIVETAKGKCLQYEQQQPGKSVKQLLPALLSECMTKLPLPKTMRWHSYSVEFIRPVHGLVMLYGKEVLDAEMFHCRADRYTYGHRAHYPEPVAIEQASDYPQLLKQVNVVADFDERKQIIQAQVQQQVKALRATALVPDDLLNEVTGLVEWPQALTARFQEKLLRVPQEALIAAMQDHQKSFAVLDDKQKILPYFITIANLESPQPERVIHGNERVMHARLCDADFFYQTDKKTPLAARIDQSKQVLFQKKLGSLYDKSQRLKRLTAWIAPYLSIDQDIMSRTAALSQCDLLTDMVGEFPELQGIMGGYYARHDGEPEAVAQALREHYLPRFSGDSLPSSDGGASLALAERVDTLIGIFGIHQPPTGVKDPFQCRRAAIAVVRLLIEKQYQLPLDELLAQSLAAYQQPLENAKVVDEVKQYILERLQNWYQQQGVSADCLQAALARQSNDLCDLDKRVQAVVAFAKSPNAQALAAANKRVGNILQKTGSINALPFQSALLQAPAEVNLAALLHDKQNLVLPLCEQANYQQALLELASLRPAIDDFFDHVMVNVEDENLRHNRLQLLSKMQALFLYVADIALIKFA